MGSAVVRRRLRVTGRVQGVFYRAGVQQAAADAGAAGTAVNRPDGSVEVVLEGSADAVAAVIEYCRRGPAGAAVDHVAVHDEWPEGLQGFTTG